MSVPIATRLENLFTMADRSDSLAAENRRLMALLDQCRAEHAALRERIQSLSRQVVHLEREVMPR